MRTVNGGVVRVTAITLVAGLLAACGCRPPGSEEGIETVSTATSPVFLDPALPETWQVSETFTFRNPSKDAWVELSVARKTCGCARCEIQDRRVPPGGQTRVTLGYDLTYERALQRHGAVIASDLEDRPEFALFLETDVYPRLLMLSERPLRVDVTPGESVTIPLTLISYSPEGDSSHDFHLRAEGTGIGVQKQSPQSQITRDSIRKTVEKWAVILSCPVSDPRCNSGLRSNKGRISIQYGEYHLQREVVWNRRSAINVYPETLFFHLANKDCCEATMTLSAAEPFSLESVECESDHVHCEMQSGHRRCEHKITVRVEQPSPKALGGRCTLSIRTDHPTEHEILVPIFVLF